MDTLIVDRLAAELAQRIRVAYIPIQYDLWDSGTIANYLKVSPKHVLQRYAPLTDFPQPIRLPSDKRAGQPLWKAAEVIAWAEKYQEKRRVPV
jgi:prophage regulatory protein